MFSGFMQFNNFSLVFIVIAYFCNHIIYAGQWNQEIEKWANYPADYFALIFFIISGVILLAFFPELTDFISGY